MNLATSSHPDLIGKTLKLPYTDEHGEVGYETLPLLRIEGPDEYSQYHLILDLKSGREGIWFICADDEFTVVEEAQDVQDS